MKTKIALDPVALRAAAEARLKSQNRSRPPQSEMEVRRLQHELEVHQIQLEMQNEELRTARAEIEAGLERYADLFDFAPVGYFTLTTDGSIRLVNLSGVKLADVDRSHLLGRRFSLLVAESDRKRFSEFLTQVFATGQHEMCDVALATEGRPPMWVNLRAQRDDGGERCRLAVMDITARKLAEAANARLALAVEQATNVVVITDTQGRILYVNPAFEQTTGYTCAEALGQNPRLLKSGRQSAEFYQKMWDTITAGKVWQGHFQNKHKDGSIYQEDATISPIRDATGKLINYVAVKRDVTRELELEAQLRQAQKMEAIGQLAGGVAHDFNNLLAVIGMQVGLLEIDGGLSIEQSALAREISVTVERGAALTRQLLLFSRRNVPDLHELDLNTIILNLNKLLWRSLGETILIQTHLAPEPMLIHADAGMMDQVLLNLAVNARDAMTAGGQLVITTVAVDFDESAVAPARPGAFVCLSVADNGCGIPAEIMSRIFEPFFTTKDVGKGTGLGLATVFGIVEKHSGWIAVASEVGQGTTFKIYLPRLAGQTNKKSEPVRLTATTGGKATILLVEDEPLLRVSVGKALMQMGYQVFEAANGVKALEVWAANSEKINLLLTDLVMPDNLNGIDLSQRLLQEKPDLKVIYTSGYSAEVAGKNFTLQAGVNFLPKPFEAHQLAQIIHHNLVKN